MVKNGIRFYIYLRDICFRRLPVVGVRAVFRDGQQEGDGDENGDVAQDESERFGDKRVVDPFAAEADGGDGTRIDTMLDFIDEMLSDDDES